MSVATELTRIQTAKSNLKTSIEAKGVQIPSNALISAYSGYVDQIQTGGGGISPNFTDGTYLFYGGRFVDIMETLLPYGTTPKYVGALQASPVTGITQAKLNALADAIKNNIGTVRQFSIQSLFANATGDWSNLDFELDISNTTPGNNAASTPFYQAFNTASSGTPIRNITLNMLYNRTGQSIIDLSQFGTLRTSGNVTIKGYRTSGSAWQPFSTFTGSGILYDMEIRPYPNADPTTTTIIVNIKNISMQNITLDSLKRIIGHYTGNTYHIEYQINSTLKAQFDADADAVALAQANNITITT